MPWTQQMLPGISDDDILKICKDGDLESLRRIFEGVDGPPLHALSRSKLEYFLERLPIDDMIEQLILTQNLSILKYLEPIYPEDMCGASDMAIKTGNLELVKQLANAAPGIITYKGALNTAIQVHSGKLRIDFVEFMLHCGADINACQQNSLTPLATAAFYGDVEVMELLLDYGADLRSGALMHACQSGDLEKIKCLLDHGVPDDEIIGTGKPLGVGISLLHKVVYDGEADVLALLLEYVPDPPMYKLTMPTKRIRGRPFKAQETWKTAFQLAGERRDKALLEVFENARINDGFHAELDFAATHMPNARLANLPFTPSRIIRVSRQGIGGRIGPMRLEPMSYGSTR